MKNATKCFLIDDDPDDQEIFSIALQEVNEHINLAVANNGAEALEKLKDVAFIPNFIFLDVNMPKMNGLQCLPEIKKLEHLKAAKVIMFSTSSDERIIHSIKELGADDYLVKPPKLQILIDNLAKIFEEEES